MNGINSRTQIPEGVRDRLPREAARMRRLSGRLQDTFQTWGYREVLTPGFEYLETVTAGAGSGGRREDLYQLFDRKGRTLALRADMTTPIARLAATKMAGEPLPLRLSYCAPVYRHRGSSAGSTNEIWQCGIELIGATGPAADAEVIAVAWESLAATGLTGVRIGLGHAGFVKGIFAASGASDEVEAGLKEALVARDLVAFEKGVADAGLAPEKADLLVAMGSFQGTYAEAADRFGRVGNAQVTQALDQLALTLSFLREVGIAGQVSLDLGLVRSLDYYTGVIFEGYTPGVGSPILGGGRYDHLLADFGGSAPATGFALELDRLLAALERQGRLEADAPLDLIVACPQGQEQLAMATARRLRAQGHSVEVDLLGRSGDQLEAYARSRGADRVVIPEATDRDGEAVLQRAGLHRLRAAAVTSIH